MDASKGKMATFAEQISWSYVYMYITHVMCYFILKDFNYIRRELASAVFE